MKHKNKLMKAMPLLGLAAFAGLGASLGASLVNKAPKPKLVNIKQNTTTTTPTEQDNLSTINGQEIVEAIKSFSLGNSNYANQNKAFNFSFYKGETAEEALLKAVRQNIKFIRDNDYTKVYQIPDSAIKITKSNNYNLFNVYIDVTVYNGKIIYFNDFNPSINSQESDAQRPMDRRETPWIQFNAITYTNVDMPILQSSERMSMVNIVYAAAGAIAALLILSLIILGIKNLNKEKYVY